MVETKRTTTLCPVHRPTHTIIHLARASYSSVFTGDTGLE